MVKQFTISETGEVLQRIYDSGVNLKLFWTREGGIDWEIRDENNAPIEKSSVNASISNPEWGKIEYSVSALAYEIHRLFPQSSFSKWYVELAAPATIKI
jgi:hypothetical protein